MSKFRIYAEDGRNSGLATFPLSFYGISGRVAFSDGTAGCSVAFDEA